MSALQYKQRRQIINSLVGGFTSPRGFLAMVSAIAIIGFALSLFSFVVFVPIDGAIRRAFVQLLGVDLVQLQLESVSNWAQTVIIVLGINAAFQNRLLDVNGADVDLLFATPTSIGAVMGRQLVADYLRSFFGGIFTWLFLVGIPLRALDVAILPLGWIAIAALALFFSLINKIGALVVLWISQLELVQERDLSPLRRALAVAGVVLLSLLGVALVVSVIARIVVGDWALLDRIFALFGSVASMIFVPAALISDLLVLRNPERWWWQLGSLLLLDLVAALLFLRTFRRGGGELLMELNMTPQDLPMSISLRSTFQQLSARFFPAWNQQRAAQAATSAPDQLAGAFSGARTQLWLQWTIIKRTPIRHLSAIGVFVGASFLVYPFERGFESSLVLSLLFFMTSLLTQIFNDVMNLLQHSNLELSLPEPRWKNLTMALLVRVGYYWLLCAISLIALGLGLADTRWDVIFFAIAYSPAILLPSICLRTSLGLIYPAVAFPMRQEVFHSMILAVVTAALMVVSILIPALPFYLLAQMLTFLPEFVPLIVSLIFAIGYGFSLILFLMTAVLYERFQPGET